MIQMNEKCWPLFSDSCLLRWEAKTSKELDQLCQAALVRGVVLAMEPRGTALLSYIAFYFLIGGLLSCLLASTLQCFSLSLPRCWDYLYYLEKLI